MSESPSIVATVEEAQGLALEPLLILDPLEALLDEHGLGTGPIEATSVGEGHSNITYLVRRAGAEVVLRRPPRGPLPPSAHDVIREARLLQAIDGTGVRVPKVLIRCDDPAVIGAPFYVMEKKEGVVMTSSIPDALDAPEQRRRIADELIDALVEIHACDWRACGLEWFGKPEGYLERQVRRFTGLWEHNKTRELPVLDRVTAWLGSNVPAQQAATIVHGDYRLGNTMFSGTAPASLNAIFDWELATIGDPLADLGYLTATYPQPGDDTRNMFTLQSVTTREGFPSRAELIARYEDASGRSMRDVRWYTTLALWKSAVFLEGSYKRLLAGTTDDPFFKMLDTGVPELAERAWAISQDAT
jgi:aminoglycoside phosphotransferase (APT) family kinase protein